MSIDEKAWDKVREMMPNEADFVYKARGVVALYEKAKVEQPDYRNTRGVLAPYFPPTEQPDELAEGVLKLTATLRYIQGIVERGENRKLADDEPVDIAILNYVKKLEDTESIQQEYCKRGWKEAQEHYTSPVRESGIELVAKAFAYRDHSENGLESLVPHNQVDYAKTCWCDYLDAAETALSQIEAE